MKKEAVGADAAPMRQRDPVWCFSIVRVDSEGEEEEKSCAWKKQQQRAASEVKTEKKNTKNG